MLKRQIAIGDIHGCYDLLVSLMDSIKFVPSEDQLIFLGDYIDRGPDSYKVVTYLASLKTEYPNNVVLLKGNHEEMAHYCLVHKNNNSSAEEWMSNGGVQTLNSYKDNNVHIDTIIPFIEKLEVYYETNNHIFVHAGVPHGKTPQTAEEDSMLWGRSFSYDGNKLAVVGHTIQHTIRQYYRTICIDTGAFYYGKLSAYDVLNDKEYFVIK